MTRKFSVVRVSFLILTLGLASSAIGQCSSDHGFTGCGISDTHAAVDLADAFEASLLQARFGFITTDSVLNNPMDSDAFSPFEYQWGTGPDDRGTWSKYADQRTSSAAAGGGAMISLPNWASASFPTLTPIAFAPGNRGPQTAEIAAHLADVMIYNLHYCEGNPLCAFSDPGPPLLVRPPNNFWGGQAGMCAGASCTAMAQMRSVPAIGQEVGGYANCVGGYVDKGAELGAFAGGVKGADGGWRGVGVGAAGGAAYGAVGGLFTGIRFGCKF